MRANVYEGRAMSVSISDSTPALNEEEQALLDLHPEECFRRAVQRGAISLDKVTEELAPRLAAAVRSIITGERVSDPSRQQDPGHLPTAAGGGTPNIPPPSAQDTLAPYPQFRRLLEEQALNWAEALAAANAIDRALGRYLTGTKYAAP